MEPRVDLEELLEAEFVGMEAVGSKRQRLDDPQPSSRKRMANTMANQSAQPQSLVVHYVHCHGVDGHEDHPPAAYYYDEPRLFKGDSRASALRGTRLFQHKIESFMAADDDINIVIQRDYLCPDFYDSLNGTQAFVRLRQPDHPRIPREMQPYFFRLSKTTDPATHTHETIHVSQELSEALESISDCHPGFSSWKTHLTAPYSKLYHARNRARSFANDILDPDMCRRVHLMFDHVEEVAGASSQEAEALFARGLVARAHLPTLFREGQVIIQEGDNSEPSAFVITKGPGSDNRLTNWPVRGYHIAFDGNFSRVEVFLRVSWPADKNGKLAEGPVPITSLNVYPLQYETTGEVERALRDRGAIIWACRQACLLEYNTPKTSFEVQHKNARYMVDYDMYRELEQGRHARDSEEPQEEPHAKDIIDIQGDQPPSEHFMLLLPPEIKAFGLHDKRWRTLSVRHLRPVRWQKKAFDQLHLKPDKKDLIKAMVQMHISSNISTDVIEGKGKGLIILLHGGPGTGKTLTAESVAELAEKPLYRVTCGDIGTSPEEVERYLESVLYIGSTWKAVVLLDESDVFLEEREKSDLQRNALVSVFLRVLEYYDGILILTSNRVGTFDEAFKSRVQLTLHYPDLDAKGRRGIWNNFFQLLKRQSKSPDSNPMENRLIELENEERINLEDLIDKIDLLAKHNLNGREIRNVITSARQLARYKKEPMDSSHLDRAIAVVDEFQTYVNKMHGHTDGQYAQYKGDRA